MIRYVVSIKPEFRAELTPGSLVDTIGGMVGLRVVEGRGRRTVTVESQIEALDRIRDALPGASVRVYEPLELLR